MWLVALLLLVRGGAAMARQSVSAVGHGKQLPLRRWVAARGALSNHKSSPTYLHLFKAKEQGQYSDETFLACRERNSTRLGN